MYVCALSSPVCGSCHDPAASLGVLSSSFTLCSSFTPAPALPAAQRLQERFTGIAHQSATLYTDLGEGDIADPLAKVAAAHPKVCVPRLLMIGAFRSNGSKAQGALFSWPGWTWPWHPTSQLSSFLLFVKKQRWLTSIAQSHHRAEQDEQLCTLL